MSTGGRSEPGGQPADRRQRSAAPATPDPSGVPDEERPLANASVRRMVGVLIPLVLLSEIVPLEMSLVYPALANIRSAFDTQAVGWTVTVVSLVALATQPLLAKVADMFGRKRTIAVAAAVFAIGSMIAALAPNFGVLLVGRALQAPGMAIVPAAYGLIRDGFPRRYVPIAVGAVNTGFGMSAIIGPFVGGFLVQRFDFRAVFWFCLVFVVVLAPLALWLVPERRRPVRRRLDITGSLLFGAGVGILLLAISQASSWGLVSLGALGCVLAAALLLWLFIVHEKRTAEPLIAPKLLTGPAVRWTLLATAGGGFVLGGHGYLMPLLVQAPLIAGGLALGPMAVAMLLLPQGVLGAVAGPLGGALARRRGPRLTMLVSLGAFTVGTALAALLNDHAGQLVLASIAMGCGFGLYFVSASNLIIEAVPASHTSLGTGFMSIANNLGNALGVTVLGAVLSAGFTPAYLVAVVVGLLSLAVVLGMQHGRSPMSGPPAPH
ncbi:MFS transporter [Saccharopolyspora sp. 5N102]|uniref:MFS transporter n=1 Tax=Saccharopolyspora sp. 5N102 TaxID=3375155 RepID=UPI0037B9958E